jgi:hypothetical protein
LNYNVFRLLLQALNQNRAGEVRELGVQEAVLDYGGRDAGIVDVDRQGSAWKRFEEAVADEEAGPLASGLPV